jgi:carbonic anhydrase/acetyltransferase-like protein (isoleucine patch superfamily)
VTVSVLSPGAALAGAVTVKCSVTVWPGAMVTGGGLPTAQPAGALSVNRACGIA